MSFEEKNTWIFAAIAVATYTVYLVIILGRAQGTALSEVPYVATMLWTIGAAMVAGILGNFVISFAWPKEAGKKDQRDREINRFGEYVGQSFVVIGGVATLVMAMAEVDHFWIANVIYLTFTLSAILGSVAKIFAYRRGFQPW